jgi:uncharacterized hydrophobic protein (TIGR00271 family)
MDKTGWYKKWIKPLSGENRKVVIDEVTPAASPGFNFYLLVVLSCSIATLGLITNSPAVIIGAMLVAPLMSPLVGIGLAAITGNTKLLRNSFLSLLVGAVLAIALATLMTLVNNLLPFISMQQLPAEVTARMHPTPVDMVIALAGGIAAAYAMTEPDLSAALPGVAIATALMPPLCTIGIGIALNRWDVAGGASLLFVTNAVTIAFAAALVFFLRGFSANLRITDHKVPRSLIIAALITVILLVPLTYFGVKFFQEATENRLINTVVAQEVKKINDADLVDLSETRSGTTLNMVITIRTANSLNYQQVVDLQKAIVDGIHQPISLKVNQVIAEELDPLIPPTATPTLTPTATSTPGPSPTSTSTPTPLPSATVTATPTPGVGEIIRFTMPALKIYQEPGGPTIGTLHAGQTVSILYGRQEFEGLVWIEIQDLEGRVGWIPKSYLQIPTATLTPTVTITP